MPTTHPLSEISNQLSEVFMILENHQENLADHPSVRDIKPNTYTFYPNFQLEEQEDSYLIKIDTPGISADDIVTRVRDNELIIATRGQAANPRTMNRQIFEAREDEANYGVGIEHYGEFVREIPLPANVRTNEVEVDFSDGGRLEITLPKLNE